MPTSVVYLVRHAEVTVEPDRPASEWRLSAAGERAARRLASAPEWRKLATVVTSPEPKALATAAPIAAAAEVELGLDERLREVERAETWVEGAKRYRAAVAEYFEAGRRAGWEPLAAVCERMGAAVTAAASAPGDACVVSHGLALAIYAASLGGRAPDPAGWAQIPLPAVAVAGDDGVSSFASVERFLAN